MNKFCPACKKNVICEYCAGCKNCGECCCEAPDLLHTNKWYVEAQQLRDRVAELESALDFLLDHVEAESRIIYKAASEGSASSTWLERSASRLVASVRLSNAANVLAKGKALTEPKTDKDEIPF
jgi:hypothetical protein